MYKVIFFFLDISKHIVMSSVKSLWNVVQSQAPEDGQNCCPKHV